MSLSVEAQTRIRAALAEQAKTDGAASQDLREFERFLDAVGQMQDEQSWRVGWRTEGIDCQECGAVEDEGVCERCFDKVKAKLREKEGAPA